MLEAHVGEDGYPNHQDDDLGQTFLDLHRHDYGNVDEEIGKDRFCEDQPGSAASCLRFNRIHEVGDEVLGKHAAAPDQDGDKKDARQVAQQTDGPNADVIAQSDFAVVTADREIHEVAREQLGVCEVNKDQRRAEAQCREIFGKSGVEVVAEIG